MAAARPGSPRNVGYTEYRTLVQDDGEVTSEHTKSSEHPLCKQAGRRRYHVASALRPMVKSSGQDLVSLQDDNPRDALSDCVMQFSSSMYFCNEKDGFIDIEVLRIGNLEQRSEVDFTTIDSTAVAGKTYVSTSERIIFEAGEREKTIAVPIVRQTGWDVTLEFQAALLRDNVVGGCLGKYLFEARVQVRNNDCFPTNRYEKELRDGCYSDVPEWGLLTEYLKMNLNDPKIFRRTLAILITDQLECILNMLQLISSVILVDNILNVHHSLSDIGIDISRKSALLVFVSIPLVSQLLVHMSDYYQASYLGIGGSSRAFLQRSLLQKFLNYGETSRNSVTPADVSMAMLRDVPAIVSHGHVGMLKAAQVVGELILVLIYQCVAPYLLGKSFKVIVLIPTLSFPILLLIFVMLRSNTTTKYLKEKNDAEDQLEVVISDASELHTLLVGFHKRPAMVELLGQRIKAFNGKAKAASQVFLNNKYYAVWLSKLTVAIYSFIGGMYVLDGATSLGFFLANIHLFNKIGHGYCQIYQVVLDMESILASLLRVTALLNLETDVGDRLASAKYRRQESKRILADVIERKSEMVKKGYELDCVPLVIQDMRFAYTQSLGEEFDLNFSGSLRIPQGSLIAMTGQRGAGKSTLLRILGSCLIDTNRKCFVPEHLRLLHDSYPPLFFHATLLDNLRMGTKFKHEGSLERVRNICLALGLPESILALLDSDANFHWDNVLSSTTHHLIGLARCLISNPEILCVHRPLFLASGIKEIEMTVMGLLRKFVDERGLEEKSANFHLRRPRTCIFTAETGDREGMKMVDQVIVVSRQGIKELELL